MLQLLRAVFLLISLFCFFVSTANSLSMSRKEIYNIPGSGWSSPKWNWGYAQGTGHDCAMICRDRWGTVENRVKLINMLWEPKEVQAKDGSNKIDVDYADELRDPPFEEVKLVLGLAWQKGRWLGSDGGRGGYGEVLQKMADCRYETDNEEQNAILFVKDLKDRFGLIASSDALKKMESLDSLDYKNDVDLLRRKCTALVLDQMDFARNGC